MDFFQISLQLLPTLFKIDVGKIILHDVLSLVRKKKHTYRFNIKHLC
jgi:hypothetical protein